MYLGPRPLSDLLTSKSTLKSILNVTRSQCKDLRTGVRCSYVLDELQLSNALLCEETITIIHPADDKGMNKFLQILTGNKTSNSYNVFEMIVC